VDIELTSPSTEQVDRGEKMRIYAKLLHVAEYYLFDPFTGRVEGHELDPSTRAYRERMPDERGRFVSRVTGLLLGVVPGRHGDIDADWLRWMTPEGEVLPTGEERAAAAMRRVAELEARLSREA
jgi:hypothetical protein